MAGFGVNQCGYMSPQLSNARISNTGARQKTAFSTSKQWQCTEVTQTLHVSRLHLVRATLTVAPADVSYMLCLLAYTIDIAYRKHRPVPLLELLELGYTIYKHILFIYF